MVSELRQAQHKLWINHRAGRIVGNRAPGRREAAPRIQGMTISLHFARQRRRASEAGRWTI